MSEEEMMKRWVDTWRQAGPLLEEIRRQEVRDLDTNETIESLSFHADFSQAPYRPDPTSGLIEQQRWFMKLRHA